MTISEIKNKWKKEKDHYKTHEVGSGVQSFVRDILSSRELFNLKEGRLSTRSTSRNYEFIQEKNAKERRRADFYIFINTEIAIPVEVECYQNIKAGETQLVNYQKDFEKQYGILTDGFSWRFYNNNVYKTYTLETIFDNTQLFLTFWKEYIKPDLYYLSFFEKTVQLALIEEIILPVEEQRQAFFEDITKLILSFKNKLHIEGYLESTEDKSKEQRAVELTYAYIIQFILYKTLVDNEFDDFPQEFEELVDTIHQSLKKNAYKDILGVINGISNTISKNIYRPFYKEQEFINTKIFELLRSLKNNLNEVSPWLDIFVFIKKYNFANVRNEIFGFIYENYLKELYEESQKGQYFTDPAVVNFMLEQISYTPEWIKKRYEFDKDSISLIDPACGSGTFLYAATDIIVQAFKDGFTEESSKKIEEAVANNIFGLDIEEFPLYLAEMSVLMRLLPLIINQKYNNPIDKKIKVFKTRDSVSEFMDTAIRNTLSDMNVEYEKAGHSAGQMSMFTDKLNLGYQSYVRDEDDLKEMKQSLENLPDIPRRRFDFVIGNPPYVSYNKSSKQGMLMFKLMKEGNAKLNNIYGVNLHSTPDNTKRYRPNPNLYAFFIALGLALLKDNGKICYIIPQTILTAGDLDVIRYHLAKFTTIEKIIVFSGKMFIGRGLKQNKPVATSSLIFVAQRKIASASNSIEVVNYKNPDDDVEKCLENIRKGKHVDKKKVTQQNLLVNVKNWNFITKKSGFVELLEKYKNNSADISIYYNHQLAKLNFNSKFYFDSGYSIDEKRRLNTPPDSGEYYYYPKLNHRFWTIKENRGYWPNIREGNSAYRIRLRQANQGFSLLDSKYKIIWSYANPKKFHFTSLPVVWARNQVCAIGTENENEIIYIFALLNSNTTRMMLDSFLKSENEKDLLVSTTSVKEFVRVPKISKENLLV
ncbi:MAG: SAM-dependent DNA methyltransferase [Candidatus Levybacteria bacterium]|nr:SAM-dependent DNA methyltransferase [Candidatus Levybacteria bacterium]